MDLKFTTAGDYMNDKVYIVVGSTGEYDDFYEWNVKAFLNKADAEALLRRIKVQYEALMGEGDRSSDYELRKAAQERMRTIDPGCCIDYTGTWYDIKGVELG